MKIKNIITLVLFYLALALPMKAFVYVPTTDQTDTVVIKKSDLSPEQLKKLEDQNKVQEISQKIETVHTWAGMGKEIGESINDGLKAVNDQAANFAKTSPGKLTMFLIAWKVMSSDVIAMLHGIKGVLLGIPFLLFIDITLIKIWNRTTRKQLVLTSVDGKLKHYEERDTWFTKDLPASKTSGMSDEATCRLAFCVAFFIVGFIANLWIFAGVIL